MLAIVLKRRDFRESDQIITLYSEKQGKLELLARGVKKIVSKNSPHLEQASLADIEVAEGKEIDRLTKVNQVNIFGNLRGNLNRSLMAGFASALTDAATEPRAVDARIFRLLRSWLEFLDLARDVGASNLKMLAAFTLKLLSLLGFTPELGKCVICGKAFGELGDSLGFYFAGGGIIGPEERGDKEKAGERVVSISPEQAENFKIFLTADWQAISKMILDEEKEKKLWEIAHEFARFHSGKRLPKWLSIA